VSDKPSTGRVLLLGGRPGTVEALVDAGARVTVVTSACHAARLENLLPAEDILVVDEPTNVESCLSVLARHGLDIAGFMTVTSGLEHGLVPAAVLGAIGGTARVDLSAVLAFRDKQLQKDKLRRCGVEVADSLVWPNSATIGQAVQRLGGTVVIKPPAGAGSKDTEKLRLSEVPRWTESASPGPWLVEAFVHGREVHVDGVVRSACLRHIVVSKYFVNMIDVDRGLLNGSYVVRPTGSPELYERAAQLASTALRVLGLQDGVFHLEAFEQADGRLVFSECACRVAGGGIATGVRLATGIDLHAEWAFTVLGLAAPPPPPPQIAHAVVANVDLVANPGRIRRLPNREVLLTREGVVDAFIYAAEGSVAPQEVDASTRAGTAIITAESERAVQELAADLTHWFRSVTVVEESN
jgi:biotin carboxylase